MTAIDNPILNSPYEPPDRYYEIGPQRPDGRDQGRSPPERVLHPDRGDEEGQEGQRRSSRRRSTSTPPASAASGTT